MDVITELFIDGAWINPATSEIMDVVKPGLKAKS